MQFFDFLMILESIIIGLGLAEILTGVGQLVRRRKGESSLYMPHVFFVALIFMGLLQHWWAAWELHGMSEMQFPELLLFVSGPVVLFLLGYLAFPRIVADWELKEYYLEFSRRLWLLVALYVLLSMVFRTAVFDAPFITIQNLVRACGLVLAIALSLTDGKRVHEWGVGLAALLLVGYTAYFNYWQGH